MSRASLPREFYESSARPLTGVSVDYPDGHWVPAHVHPRAQLVHAVRGVMLVGGDRQRWVVPPNRALWLPPGQVHDIRMRGAVQMRSLFVDGFPGMPVDSRVIEVQPLLRELIVAVTRLPPLYPLEGRNRHLLGLLLDELRQQRALPPLRLPWPAEPRLAAVCERLLAQPGDARSVVQWAGELAVSGKTFQRHFRRQTGLGFARWRQQARLLGALEHLAAGRPIGHIASRQGYASQSAFASAFRAHFGLPPSQFITI